MHKQQMDILCPLVVNLTLRLNRKWKKAAIIYYCKKQVTVFIVLWFYMILSFLVQESVSMYKALKYRLNFVCIHHMSFIQSLKRMVHFRKVLCEKKLYCNFIYGINMHWTPIYIECLIVYSLSSHSRIFMSYRDITITNEGLQKFGLCMVIWRREESRVLYLLWHGTLVYTVFSKEPPCLGPSRQARVHCWPYPSWIPSGYD